MLFVLRIENTSNHKGEPSKGISNAENRDFRLWALPWTHKDLHETEHSFHDNKGKTFSLKMGSASVDNSDPI